MYRVNYGNGQVSQTFATKRAATSYMKRLTQYRAFAFLQLFDRDTREWCSLRRTPEDFRVGA
jgi:hypothetical protein